MHKLFVKKFQSAIIILLVSHILTSTVNIDNLLLIQSLGEWQLVKVGHKGGHDCKKDRYYDTDIF